MAENLFEPISVGDAKPRSGSWTVEEVLVEAWDRFKEHPAVLMVGAVGMSVATFLLNLPMQVVGADWLATFQEQGGVDPIKGADFAKVFSGILLILLCQLVINLIGRMCINRLALAAARQGPVRLKGMFEQFGRIGRMLRTQLSIWAGGLAGLVLSMFSMILMVPFLIMIVALFRVADVGGDLPMGVGKVVIEVFPLIGCLFLLHCALRLLFAQFYVIDSDLGAWACLRASWQATKGLTLRLTGLFLAFGLGALLATVLTLGLGIFVVVPMYPLVLAVVYLRISEGSEKVA